MRRRSSPAPETETVALTFVQNLSLGALLGANMFGRFAMHPALESISGKAERGKVLNEAWRRYGTINSLALIGLVAGWSRERRRLERGGEESLRLAKDLAVGAVALTGAAAAAGGVGFAQQAPQGAVPMASGHDPAPETPSRAVALKRLVNLLGGLNLMTEVMLAALNAARARTGASA